MKLISLYLSFLGAICSQTIDELLQKAEMETSAIAAIEWIKLVEQRLQTDPRVDEKSTKRYNLIISKLSNEFQNELLLARNLIATLNFTEASDIYSRIINYAGVYLDKSLLEVCLRNLGHCLFRNALVGYARWDEVESVYAKLSFQRELYEDEKYYYQMAIKNAVFSRINHIHNQSFLLQPYVLKFHIPQNYQTPSLAHFGHVIFDALLPFCVAYLKGAFTRASPSITDGRIILPGAPIYVLDIGLYLTSVLRTLFPEFLFIEFFKVSQIPMNAQSVNLYGVGMPR